MRSECGDFPIHEVPTTASIPPQLPGCPILSRLLRKGGKPRTHTYPSSPDQVATRQMLGSPSIPLVRITILGVRAEYEDTY